MADARIEELPVAERTRVAYPRRRRGAPLLAITLMVVVGLAIAADRVAANAAADRIRTEVVAELDERGVRPASTDVTVDGFPFLFQVVDGHYEKITIDMRRVNISGTTLPSLLVVARGVDADTADLVDGKATVTAERVTGTAVVDWTTMANLVDYARLGLSGVTFGTRDGALQVRGTAQLAGLRVPMSATADLGVDAGVVRIRLRDARVEDGTLAGVAQAQLDALAQRLSVDIRIPPLPFRLAIDDVRPEDDGLSITATARAVPLAS
jgi:hypothetical protein